MRTRKGCVPVWQRAFLHGLAQTGNVQLACARAPIDKSMAYRRRAQNPGFATAWDAAKAKAGTRLWADACRFPEGAAARGVDAADTRAMIVVGGRGAIPPRIQPARRFSWTPEKEQIFLETLASTCNVLEAARAAGTTTGSAYQRRARWPGFEHEWKMALESGMLALEFRLIEAVGKALSGERVIVPQPMPVASIADALMLLGQHRKQKSGTARRHWAPKLPDIEEVRAEVLRKIAALARHGGT